MDPRISACGGGVLGGNCRGGNGIMTVLEAIQRSTGFLAGKGVDSPRLQAEHLLAHVLQVPRLRLYLDFERRLAPDEVDRYRECLKRRGHREPLQHILGTVSFCGLELRVSPQVFIPRPETELLAEMAWRALLRSAGGDNPAPVALDFGTGSGCLAIAVAVHCPKAKVLALEVSAAALEVARDNAARHVPPPGIEFFLGDGLGALPPNQKVDLIVSNPPYIPSEVIQNLEPEVRDYDPRAALDGGDDGLAFYRKLAREAASVVARPGRVLVEFGDGQEQALPAIFSQFGWDTEAICRDDSGRPRFLVAVGGGNRSEPL